MYHDNDGEVQLGVSPSPHLPILLARKREKVVLPGVSLRSKAPVTWSDTVLISPSFQFGAKWCILASMWPLQQEVPASAFPPKICFDKAKINTKANRLSFKNFYKNKRRVFRDSFETPAPGCPCLRVSLLCLCFCFSSFCPPDCPLCGFIFIIVQAPLQMKISGKKCSSLGCSAVPCCIIKHTPAGTEGGHYCGWHPASSSEKDGLLL